MPTVSREVKVINKLGLHARPAMLFVDMANNFKSDISVHKGGDDPVDADGKSIMAMMTLAAEEGTPLRIDANGDDAQQAIETLAELVKNKFGEEE